MWKTWTLLSREQKRVWKFVAATIVAGSVFKVAYFRFSRNLIVNDSDRQQRQGMERLQEAREFAEWSKKDREARLPKLTPEQREQMRSYLRIVEEHGLAKAFQSPDGKGCDGEGCPVLARTRKVVATITGASSK